MSITDIKKAFGRTNFASSHTFRSYCQDAQRRTVNLKSENTLGTTSLAKLLRKITCKSLAIYPRASRARGPLTRKIEQSLAEHPQKFDQQLINFRRTLLLGPMADASKDDLSDQIRHIIFHCLDVLTPETEHAVTITSDK